MREIELSQGQRALVDDDDYGWLSQHKWCVTRNGSNKTFYAVRTDYVGGKRRLVWMHREILGLKYGDPRRGDHKSNGETLDNRKSNLRIATVSQNAQNSVAHRDNSTGFKGVSWFARDKRFVVQVHLNGKRYYRAYFKSLIDAAQVQMLKAFQAHGEFSYSGKALN